MAKTIATVSGVALKPGVSRNRRLYSREAIAAAVKGAQEAIGSGGMPLTMRSHHAADDDSTRIVGAVRSLTLDEDGSARFSADIADTEHGRTIASLLDTTDGKPPFLSGVSIRGAWEGKVRRETVPDVDGPVERGDKLALFGLDYTASPGVRGAGVDTFAWAKAGATETTERVLITESVQEARVTITEETGPAGAVSQMPDGVREVLRAVFGEAVTEAGTPALSKRDSGLAGAGRQWADPGYQADKKQRYDISSKAKAKAAWSYINQGGNAKAYSAAQLKRVKGRIRAALKKFGVTVAAEGWSIEPALKVTEAIAEYAGMDPDTCGSYSLTASNGPTTVTVCSYGLDPADIGAILMAACTGATAALCALDPDMDGDIDVPGADTEDTDDDAGDGTDDLAARLAAAIRGESDQNLDALVAEARGVPAAVTETAPADPAPEPDAERPNEEEAPAVSETTTTEAAGTATAATFTQADITTAVTQALDADRAARKARKAAKANTAEAAPAPAATVTETDDDRIARIVEAQLAAARPVEAPAVTETEDQKIERIVEARLVAERQALTAQGLGPSRKGLVTEHTAARADGEIPADFPMKDGVIIPTENWTETQRRAVGRELERHVLGARAST